MIRERHASLAAWGQGMPSRWWLPLLTCACVTESNVVDALNRARCESSLRCWPDEFRAEYDRVTDCADAWKTGESVAETEAYEACQAAACTFDAGRASECVRVTRTVPCDGLPDDEADAYMGCAYADWWSECDAAVYSACVFDQLGHAP